LFIDASLFGFSFNQHVQVAEENLRVIEIVAAQAQNDPAVASQFLRALVRVRDRAARIAFA